MIASYRASRIYMDEGSSVDIIPVLPVLLKKSTGSQKQGHQPTGDQIPTFNLQNLERSCGRVGGGLVVDGGRSSRVSRKAWGEVGGVENNSSIGSRLMARCDVSLDGWEDPRLEKLVEDPKYSPMEVRMVDREEFVKGKHDEE
ncbi:hypothetical protein Tco_0989232 [Tanacetum coccineum]|uniref:Uncharacterized protein n=1 Tax=Tanacetum coccineum TaxID=301880 RepID=A0ABQ5ET26_9ASTR